MGILSLHIETGRHANVEDVRIQMNVDEGLYRLRDISCLIALYMYGENI